MGLFDFLFKQKTQDKLQQTYMSQFKTLTAYSPMFYSWNGELYESELVRSAIDARARHISKLRVEMLGAAQPQLKTRITKRPNNWQTWSQFLYRASTILDMQNTCFILPVLNRFDETIGFFTALPSSCEILETADHVLYLRYRFSSGNTGIIEMQRCGIMNKFQYSDDFFGENNYALDDTMNLINLQNQGIKEAIKNGATYRFMAQASNFSKTGDLSKERKRFSEENLRADSDGGGILLFPNTYQNIQQIKDAPFTVDADEMKLIQTNVFNYYGVNEDVLQNKAIGDVWSAFYEGAVEVFAIQLSEVLTQMTFTDREQASGSEFMATANRLQYMSNKDKLSVSSQMADRGIMTRNEIREIWNMPPVEGGDEFLARGEYHPVEVENEDDRGED